MGAQSEWEQSQFGFSKVSGGAVAQGGATDAVTLSKGDKLKVELTWWSSTQRLKTTDPTKEMWNCPLSLQNLSKYAEDIDARDSPSISMLSEVASCHKVIIVGGSIPESANGRLFNTCCVLGADGEIKAKHRKLHLFDVDIPGDINFRESDTLTAGDAPTIVDTDVGSIGIGICYDIRFPELAMLYRSRGAHLICYPGAFNTSTGQLLWELMQRSSA